MRERTSLLAGVIAPLATPMRAPALPEAEFGRRHMEALAAAGVDGLLLFGSNGEGPLIEDREVERYAREAVSIWHEYSPDGPVLFNVSAPGTSALRARAEAAARGGVDGLTASAPSYFRHRDDEVIGHLTAVTEFDLPVIVYDIPRSANPLTEGVLAAVLEHPQIVGIKDSSGDIEHLRRTLAWASRRPGFGVSQGSESQLIDGLDAGVVGILPGTANIAPRLAVELFRAWNAGDRERAVSLQELTASLTAIHSIRPGVPSVKRILSERGFLPSCVAPPLVECTDGEWARLEGLLSSFDEWLVR